MTPEAYFERAYGNEPDPFKLEGGRYELRKRALVLAILPHLRYRRGFEPGCGPGQLSEQLAARCDALLASDFSARALEQARQRIARCALTNVQLERLAVPEQWPDASEPFDLIVVSELLYFLAADELVRFHARLLESTTQGAHVVLVHWRHGSADYPLDGDRAHAVLRERPGLVSLASYRERDFLIELLERP